MTDIADTSREAHDAIHADGSADANKERIFQFMLKYQGPLTRQDLEEFLGMKINVVCGRVFDLLEEKRIEVTGSTRLDRFGRKCRRREFLMVKAEQLKLFGKYQRGEAIQEAKAA
jgi:hypothetical protein